MKDLLPVSGIAAGLLAQVPSDAGFWERILERWGIGLVGMGLFFLLAKWTAKREEDRESKKDKLDADNQSERVGLLAKNNELLERQIRQAEDHARELKGLVKESNKVQADHASAVRMMTLKFRRPCVMQEDPAQIKLDFPSNEHQSD